MKPAPFVHHVPKTLDEALRTLAEVAPKDGRVLAGGQSLVPIMAFRLAKPAHLVDINGVAGLDALACAMPRSIKSLSPIRSDSCSQPLRAISRTIRFARAARSAEVLRTPIPHRNGVWLQQRSMPRLSHKACAAPAPSRRVIFSPASCPRPWPKTNYSPRHDCPCSRMIPDLDSTNSVVALAISP